MEARRRRHARATPQLDLNADLPREYRNGQKQFRRVPQVSYEGVVILASPRSGSTLFQRILRMHPSPPGPPENNVLNATGRFLREVPGASGFGVGVVSGMAFAGMSEDELHRRAADFALGLLA